MVLGRCISALRYNQTQKYEIVLSYDIVDSCLLLISSYDPSNFQNESCHSVPWQQVDEIVSELLYRKRSSLHDRQHQSISKSFRRNHACVEIFSHCSGSKCLRSAVKPFWPRLPFFPLTPVKSVIIGCSLANSRKDKARANEAVSHFESRVRSSAHHLLGRRQGFVLSVHF